MADQIALQAWQGFFGTAGGAAATLAGLLFVGTSLQLRRISSVPELLAVSTETTVEFGMVLLGSLVMLMAASGWLTGGPIAVLGLLGSLAAGVELRRGASSAKGRSALAEQARLLLPVGGSVLVLVGGVGIGIDWAPAPYLLALTMALLLGLGLRNAWEILLQSGDQSPEEMEQR
jgi:hypothetical protein